MLLSVDNQDAFWLSTAYEICRLVQLQYQLMSYYVSIRSYITMATSSILESELSSCEQLLELEPENKCE